MELLMDTESARVLATSSGDRSERALTLRDELLAQLEAAEMADTYGVADSLSAMSDELHTGDLVLRHQADTMDGLTVDLDALAQDLGVERWRIEQQLRRVDDGAIDVGEAIISLVDWADYTVLGFDTTVREFVVDAPPLGEDPDFDALVQRLDGWLLSQIVDGKPIDPPDLSDIRRADMAALAEWMSMPDPSTIEVERSISVRRFPNDNSDTRMTSVSQTMPLPTEEYESWTLEWIAGQLTNQRKLSHVADVSSIGELSDLTMKQGRRWEGHTDDGDWDFYDVHRIAEEWRKATAQMNEKRADLAWLPAVLAGTAVPPAELATDTEVDGLRLGGGLYKGRWAAGLLYERSGADGDGRVTSTVNANSGLYNANATWTDDESYLQNLIPGSTPMQRNPNTGFLEPVSLPEPELQPRSRVGRAITGDRARKLP
ncbi:MAG: hypothetical protein AAF962_17035 [Actinomycetota bacterium]